MAHRKCSPARPQLSQGADRLARGARCQSVSTRAVRCATHHQRPGSAKWTNRGRRGLRGISGPGQFDQRGNLMVITIASRRLGAMMTELLVAMALLTGALLPLAYSFRSEKRLANASYQRAVAMEIV